MIFKGALSLTALCLLTLCVSVFAQGDGATNPPSATAAQSLQGTWENTKGDKVAIQFTGNTLRFQGRDSNDWYEATFTLPAGTKPQQMRATISRCLEADYVGVIVNAIFKIEDGTLTLVGIQDRDKEPPKNFGEAKASPPVESSSFNLQGSVLSLPGDTKAFDDKSVFHYELRRVRVPEKKAELPRSN